MKNKQPKKAALYCRLSVDDGRMGESVSIGSQKLLLEQYCKDHAIDNYEVYDDDGYSGTIFDRPAFQRMYEDIQNGLIDTVLVKDQSRFGRSYIEVGMYVEKFNELGVRFIAVSDNYDSVKNENDMMFPMRNVLNDYFAREASIKTKTAKKAKRTRRSSKKQGSTTEGEVKAAATEQPAPAAEVAEAPATEAAETAAPAEEAQE